jgi:hypothetical protein
VDERGDVPYCRAVGLANSASAGVWVVQFNRSDATQLGEGSRMEQKQGLGYVVGLVNMISLIASQATKARTMTSWQPALQVPPSPGAPPSILTHLVYN